MLDKAEQMGALTLWLTLFELVVGITELPDIVFPIGSFGKSDKICSPICPSESNPLVWWPTCKRFLNVTNSLLKLFKRCCKCTASLDDDASGRQTELIAVMSFANVGREEGFGRWEFPIGANALDTFSPVVLRWRQLAHDCCNYDWPIAISHFLSSFFACPSDGSHHLCVAVQSLCKRKLLRDRNS